MITLQKCCHQLLKQKMLLRSNTLTCEKQQTSPLLGNRSSAGGGSDLHWSSFTGDGQGRQASHGQSTLTDARIISMLLPSMSSSHRPILSHLENTRAGRLPRLPTSRLAGARAPAKTLCARALMGRATRRGQSCSCGWVTVSHHSRQPTHGNWEPDTSEVGVQERPSAPTAIIRTDQPIDRLVRRLSVPVL